WLVGHELDGLGRRWLLFGWLILEHGRRRLLGFGRRRVAGLRRRGVCARRSNCSHDIEGGAVVSVFGSGSSSGSGAGGCSSSFARAFDRLCHIQVATPPSTNTAPPARSQTSVLFIVTDSRVRA